MTGGVPGGRSGSDMRRTALVIAALALAYWAAARLGLLLAFQNSNASPVWPPSGIAFAALALGGPRLAAGVALGAFAANLQVFFTNQVASTSTLLAVSTVIAAGNTLEAWCGVLAWRRWRGGSDEPAFDRLVDVAKFALVAALACTIAAAAGSLALLAGGIVPQAAGITVALTWWLGDFAGVMLLAPLLLAWPAWRRPGLRALAEALLSLALLALLAYGVFMHAGGGERWLVWCFIPAFAWAAWRFGAGGAAAATLIVAGFAIAFTTQGRGPFAGGSLNDALLQLDTFVLLCAASALVFAADRSERLRLNRSLRSDLLAPWAVLLGCLAVSVAGWQAYATQADTQAADRFATEVDRIERQIASRMTDYEELLRGASGLFAASGTVGRDAFRAYVERLNIERRLPGIQGLGYARMVAPAELEAHEAAVRAEGFADYAVKPAGERALYSAIVFLEPFNERNRRAFGFDMWAEPVRRAAMEQARDSGQPAVSGKVRLLQETTSDVQAGVLMYLPVYRQGALLQTAEQRRAAHVGFVYAPFRMNNLVRGAIGDDWGGVTLQLYDGTATTDAALLFDGGLARPPRPSFAARRTISLPGRDWTLAIASLPPFDATIDRQKAQFVLIAGVVFSLLLFTLVRALTLTRERAQLLANDMTRALRASETMARDSERQLRAVMNASPAGVVFTNERGALRYANPSFLRIAGIGGDEKLPEFTSRTLHPDDRDRVAHAWGSAVRNGAPFDAEYRFRHDDGNVVWAHARSAAIVDAERVVGHVAIVEDISARRELDAQLRTKSQALERSNSELEQFAYVASHDLQEPLRAVGSYSQLLLRRHRAQMDSEAREFLDFVGEGAQRAQALIADLLALARIDSRARPFQPVALADALDDARRALRVVLRESGAALTNDDPLPRLHGDRSQLAQLLQNLIGNALKFRGAEPPRVHVAARREQGGWRIEVIDNGIGIDPRFHERIFTLFQRLHGRDAYPGTGIGLTICKKVVERHGGRIGVESAPGRGSTFFATIPDRAGPDHEEPPA